MTQNVFVSSLRYILIEVIGDIFYFPVWWYSAGLVRAGRYCIRTFQTRIRNIALGLWLRSMFKPMFGDYSRQGRLISIFMRLVVLIYKLALTVFALFYSLLLFLLWVILPIVIAWYLLFQVFGLPLPFSR